MSNRNGGDGAEEERLSLIEPIGYSASTCGYCGTKGERSQSSSSRSYGIWAHYLSPYAYERLIERGWRRSGSYVYRPDCSIDGTCCAQLAIRLRVEHFKAKRQHKHALACLQRALYSVQEQSDHASRPSVPHSSHQFSLSALSKGKYTRAWSAEAEWEKIEIRPDDNDLIGAEQTTDSVERQSYMAHYHDARSLLASECRKGQRTNERLEPPYPLRRRRVTTTLSVASSTDEKYALFRQYQAVVHGQKQDDISSRRGFERFLCEAPFLPTHPLGRAVQMCQGQGVDICSDEPIHYGLYHMEWRLDNKLVAVGVLDILPHYLSSVYFFYDPTFETLQLGKVSTIREIVLVEQLRRKRGMEGMRFYTMGLYIHDNPKMRYKANFGPAELLDPATNEWIHLDRILPALDSGVRTNFLKQTTKGAETRRHVERAKIDEGEDAGFLPIPPPPGMKDPSTLSTVDVNRCIVFDGTKAGFLTSIISSLPPEKKRRVLDCLAALDLDQRRYCLVV